MIFDDAERLYYSWDQSTFMFDKEVAGTVIMVIWSYGQVVRSTYWHIVFTISRLFQSALMYIQAGS